jgi:hypothetical protein
MEAQTIGIDVGKDVEGSGNIVVKMRLTRTSYWCATRGGPAALPG